MSRGGGWGFAKAAELNGIPGPTHVLGMAKELSLTAAQDPRVREVFGNMRREAVAEGVRYVSLETDLEEMFVNGGFRRKIWERDWRRSRQAA